MMMAFKHAWRELPAGVKVMHLRASHAAAGGGPCGSRGETNAAGDDDEKVDGPCLLAQLCGCAPRCDCCDFGFKLQCD